VLADDAPFVHASALCESNEIGARTRVWAFAHVMAGAIVGAECNICDHVFVEAGAVIGDRVTVKNNALIWDGVRIEDDVFIGPNVVFTNDARPRAEVKKGPAELMPTIVRRGVTIGANATIVCGHELGAYAFVGAGAVVISDLPPHALALGNPARCVGWACRCGRRLPDDLVCVCGRRYRRLGRGLQETSATHDRA